jgi:pimeloyl-ACP methyl ester carboxylesterase
VTGSEDVLTPPQNARMMAERVPGSWLMRFAEAGHGLMYQDPKGLAEAVRTFLKVTSNAPRESH